MIDRRGWEPGPWDDAQMDKAQWTDLPTGLPCVALRNGMGTWCGYVGVNDAHPFHGKGYDEGPSSELEVHGGCTYAKGMVR